MDRGFEDSGFSRALCAEPESFVVLLKMERSSLPSWSYDCKVFACLEMCRTRVRFENALMVFGGGDTTITCLLVL
jgi:hypothetical protein